jgi:hypothetical protein
MTNTKKAREIGGVLLSTIGVPIAAGMTYLEALAMFRAAVFLMEEIHRNPNIDEDFLAKKSFQFCKNQLDEMDGK